MTVSTQNPVSSGFDRARLIPVADWLAVALVASLPWSTSATGILVVAWLVVALPTLNAGDIRRELLTPAGGLPVLLWALGVVGMLWADVPWGERFNGLSSFHKLLLIPILLTYFRRSGRGRDVLLAFLISCTLLLAASWIVYFLDLEMSGRRSAGVPVKDYISQSAMFTISACLLGYLAIDAWRQKKSAMAGALALLAAIFLLNIAVIAVSRTALIVAPILLVTLAFFAFGWRGMCACIGIIVVGAALAWPFSPFLQYRVIGLFQEVQQYQADRGDARQTPAGERLEFWRKSIEFVSEAPIIGHGTGSITEQFRRSAEGKDKTVGAVISSNPHNQTLTVAVQLGALGGIALWAMWFSHLLLFRGFDFLAWAGFVVVAHNILGSLFNSHLSDFTHGWVYVLGVGIMGGLWLRRLESRKMAVA